MLETLVALVVVQECWADLAIFSDEMKFSELTRSLRFLLPTQSWTIQYFPT